MLTKASNVFTARQQEVLADDSRHLILHGAKRSGKTYVLIIKFLMLVASMKNKNYKFIIGGATSTTIKKNVLDDMGELIGREIKVGKENSFKLFGNEVLVRAGDNSSSWKGVRGFTAYGALLNEGTALNDTFIKEAISRCSGKGSKIYIDTNPDGIMHKIKLDYVDKTGDLLSNGKLNINSIHFKLEDNTFLDPEYVESIKKVTPTGMFYDRDILGLWVNAEGIIYKDFDSNKHINKSTCIESVLLYEEYIIEYISGVDWGFGHYGSVVVVAYTSMGRYLVLEETTETGLYVDKYWLPLLKKKNEEYKDIVFYCDSARPEYYHMALEENLEIFNANKSVNAGIEFVASLFKQDRLVLCTNLGGKSLNRLQIEIASYIWSKSLGDEKPLKTNDDALDALRYALYSHHKSLQSIKLF